MIWRIDEELCVPSILWVVNGVNLDAARAINTHTTSNSVIHSIGVIAVLTKETSGIVPLTVTVCYQLGPRGHFFLRFYLGINLPRQVVEIERIFLWYIVQFKRDGLQILVAKTFIIGLFRTDSTNIFYILPILIHIIIASKHRPGNIVARSRLTFHRYICRFVSTHTHAKAVFLTGLPHMIWRIDKELCVPRILWVINGVDLDATRTINTYTICNSVIHCFGVITILNNEAGSIVTLTVTVCYPLGPRDHFFLRLYLGINLPRDIIKIVVVLFRTFVQLEGDGLKWTYFPASVCANLLTSDGSFIVDFIPIGSDVITTVEHTPINISTRGFLCLYGDIGGLVGTHFHTETISLAGLPHMIWRIDEELRVPSIFRVINGVDLDAARAINTHTVSNSIIRSFRVITVLTNKASSIVTLTITVCYQLGPCRFIASLTTLRR